MLTKSALRLLNKHAEPGSVKVSDGEGKVWKAKVNGCDLTMVCLSGTHGRVFGVMVTRVDGEELYWGDGLRDGLRVALKRSRHQSFTFLGLTCRVLVDITRAGLRLEPRPCFMLGGCVVSNLAGPEALAAAEDFIEGGPVEPLVDWLTERNAGAAAWAEEMRRLAV